jgi:hypothetical protein
MSILTCLNRFIWAEIARARLVSDCGQTIFIASV